ncbi:MAG: DUF885 domain-containing protein [Acidimicrobiia bacterium]|nr:DUF885 domain-containing protein [Acidimicrobiia bacterium]
MDIWQLSDTAVDEMAALYPVDATYVGVEGHDHRWTDYSPDGIEASIDYHRDFRRRIDALEADPDPWAERAARVGRMYTDLELGHQTHEDVYRQLRTLACPLYEVREVFDVMDTESAEGREAITARLSGVADALAGVRATLGVGIDRDLLAARRQVLGAIEQCRTNAGNDSALRALVGTMREHGATESELSAADAAAAAAAAAYGDIGDWLEESYLPGAPEADGVGRERYAAASNYFLGMEVDLEETYRWGWSEIKRIQADMEALAEQIQPGAGRREVVELLNTDPTRRASREEFVRFMQERQDVALRDLDGTHFDVPEAVKQVDTKLAPPGAFIGAYYIGPSEDFSRPGSVWFSVGENETIPVWDNVSTAYHEGFPGHHLQTGVQMSLAERTSRLQRVWIWYSGSGEGWALYSETLMRELGYFEKPEYVFGMLASEMLRACRVVVDIGMHVGLSIPEDQPFHSGEAWTFDTAVEMLTDYAGQLPDYAKGEVTRYLGWPGQAPAYKIGERVILELREEQKAQQGTAFDLKQFHADVLEAGPVGLDLLQEFVRGSGATRR